MTTDELERAAWLEWRSHGIGASEIAAVCGLNPWASPLSVYLRKRGELPDDAPPNEAMRLGHALEGIVADEFQTQTGLHVIERQAWCEHPELSWARCTVDGFAAESADSSRADALGVFESKTTGNLASYDPLPDYVALQVQWQLFVTGEQHAWLAVLGGGHRLSVRVLEVHRDEAAIADMVKAGGAFWLRVIEGEPPPIETYAPGDAADLLAAYPEPEPGAVLELGDEGAELIAELKALRESETHIHERVVRTENAVKALLGNAEVGTVDDEPAVTWKAQSSSRIDVSALRKDEPRIAELYTVQSSGRRFLLK